MPQGIKLKLGVDKDTVSTHILTKYGEDCCPIYCFLILFKNSVTQAPLSFTVSTAACSMNAYFNGCKIIGVRKMQ